MKLLSVHDIAAIDFTDAQTPRYAILSHTWEEEEVTFEQLRDPGSVHKKGYDKIHNTCLLAAQHGFEYAWVDTCCIDKSSSAELSEAINSMFYWYQQAAVCYVYLSDLAPDTNLSSESGLACSRWFTRGWTLQELIAPRDVRFYDREWNFRGTKMDLSHQIHTITGIPESLLRHESTVFDFATAQRMSWVARRETTRIEDIAYCMLGIFNVSMSPRYGERMEAFTRLQKKIIKQPMAELGIFAWTNKQARAGEVSGVLAESPSFFQDCTDMEASFQDSIYRNLALTTRGIQLDISIHQIKTGDHDKRCVMFVQLKISGSAMGISLRKISGNVYARLNPSTLVELNRYDIEWTDHMYYQLPVETILLARSLLHHRPFDPTDPVLGNRSSALKVRYAIDPRLPDLPLGSDRPYQLYPVAHWDSHHECFFGTNELSYGYSAFFFYVGSEEFFAACFWWNVDKPRALIVPLKGMDGTRVVVLQNCLDKMRFECAGQTERMIKRLLGDSVYDGSVGLEMPLRVHETQEPIMVSLTLTTIKEEIPEICANSVTILRIGVAVLTSETQTDVDPVRFRTGDVFGFDRNLCRVSHS
ncbi:heterokaryon incompatibility protein-domain-containing protein [Triangularia verruculosa]|uniref:Heterokaryon incompatibility protein-domain-containing protein n=1 Tax=Triangularia verruculosa TaxID=2587418 RepID=A0AAN7ARE0_9PEZI|nr:heterokaryon incompatibility protein-domain-containing protein [Triangularia verruculosa]